MIPKDPIARLRALGVAVGAGFAMVAGVAVSVVRAGEPLKNEALDASGPSCPAPVSGGNELQHRLFEAIRGGLAYPAAACAEGREGTVVAWFRAVDGAPFQVEIRKSSGDARLDHAVLLAVSRATMLPRTGEVTVIFKSR